jgi:hypothetical protein
MAPPEFIHEPFPLDVDTSKVALRVVREADETAEPNTAEHVAAVVGHVVQLPLLPDEVIDTLLKADQQRRELNERNIRRNQVLASGYGKKALELAVRNGSSTTATVLLRETIRRRRSMALQRKGIIRRNNEIALQVRLELELQTRRLLDEAASESH